MDASRVVSHDFPYLPIRVSVRGWGAEAEALLDTGFTGELIVPADAIPQDIGAPAYFITYRVADDRIVSSPVFYGDIEIPGLPPVSDVAIGVLGSKYIIGVGIMELYRIVLERARQVIVEL